MTRRPLTAETLWDIARVGAPIPTGDGDAIVGVTTFAEGSDRGTGALHRVRLDGTASMLDTGGLSAGGPALSPDGERLAFVGRDPDAGDDEPPQVWVMALDGSERRKITDLPFGARDPRFLPDGRVVCVGDLRRDAPSLSETVEKKEAIGGKSEPYVTEDRVYRFWDRWLVPGRVSHLFVIEPDGGEPRDLLPGFERWFPLMEPDGNYDISPDGSRIAFTADVEDAPHPRIRWGVWVVDVDTPGEPRCITPEHPAHAMRPRFSGDGARVLLGRNVRPDLYADRLRLAWVDVETSEEEVLTEAWDRAIHAWEIDDGGAIWLLAEDHLCTHAYRLAASGGTPERIVEGGTVSAANPADDGSVWLLRQMISAPPALHRWSVEDGMSEALGGFNTELLDGLALGRVERRTFRGADDAEIEGFVVYPPGHDGGPSPMVHLIHGGPHGVFGDQFHFRWNAHLWAAPGWVVALVNFHGSSSFGTEFRESIVGGWGDKPARDVLGATDQLIEEGVADPERIAIAGGSFGGYLSAWLTTQTDRFACAITHAGVHALEAMYASDVTHSMETAMGAAPWEDRERFARYDPIAHAASISTPTLIIHGERDYRVPYTQALELYGVLKAREVPARLVMYPDENHWVLKRRHSIHWYGEVHAWLERWLGR